MPLGESGWVEVLKCAAVALGGWPHVRLAEPTTTSAAASLPVCAHGSISGALPSSPRLACPVLTLSLCLPCLPSCCRYETSSLYCADVFNTFLPIKPDHW